MALPPVGDKTVIPMRQREARLLSGLRETAADGAEQ